MPTFIAKESGLEVAFGEGHLALRLSGSATEGDWWPVTLEPEEATMFRIAAPGLTGRLCWSQHSAERWDYTCTFASERPVRLRLGFDLGGGNGAFHLIPACLFGDNNHDLVRRNEFPTLHEAVDGDQAAAPLWEFRADRAACPVSILCGEAGVVGLSIDPYAEDATAPEGFVRNGLFSALPQQGGVSLGYGNDPLTYENKTLFSAPTAHRSRKLQATGSLYLLPKAERSAAHRIVRDLHGRLREPATPQRTAATATRALAERFIDTNWSEEFGNYSNLACQVPVDTELKAWRPVSEIGWSGGGVFAYPLMVAAQRMGDLEFPKTGAQILDEIIAGWDEKGGLFDDVAGPSLVGVPGQGGKIVDGGINGWWSGFMPHTLDRHTAYTNGHAAYYLLKCARWTKAQGTERPDWVEAAGRVLETVMALQREDGAFGYLFSAEQREVVDWDGFAGCWFAAALPLAYELTGEPRYLESARRALRYYGRFVAELNCYGCPMDTYKSVDQEGILGFVQAARNLHAATGEAEWLAQLQAGADYEFLWRYAYRARPEYAPLKGSNWNSCGGSVTSVSNPHIHPMGLVITEPLLYLAAQTGDAYYRQRAEEGVAWALHTLELYPAVAGYGAYGLLTERYCPSDGLVIERFADTGAPSSLWWSYNAWAAANVLEGLLEYLQRGETVG